MVAINGYPNTFWGWGGEDDEMQARCEECSIAWSSPPPGIGTITDLEGMTLPEKLDFLRGKKEWKCMVKWEVLKEHGQTWRTNGLKSLAYEVKSETFHLDIGPGRKVTRVEVDVGLNGGHWSDEKCGVDYAGG